MEPDVPRAWPALPSTWMEQVFGDITAQAAKAGLLLPSQSLPDNGAAGENEAGSHSALEACRSHFTLLPTSYSFQDFSPFFGPKPSNLLSKASSAAVGHNPVQWVVVEYWGEI